MELLPVRCIGMTEEDMAAIEAMLKPNPLYNPSAYSASGTATEAQIAELEHTGVLVERLPGSDESVGLRWLEPDAALAGMEAMSALEPARDTPLGRLAERGTEHYILQFQGELTRQDREQLERLNIELGSYVPDFAYKVALTRPQREAVSELGAVRRVVPYDLPLTLRRLTKLEALKEKPVFAGDNEDLLQLRRFDPLWRLGVMDSMALQTGPAMYHVRCHDPADLPAVAEALGQEPQVVGVERGRNRLRITLEPNPEAERLIAEIGSLPQVSAVEPFEFPTPDCEFVRKVISVDGAGGHGLPWHGEGQVVGVVDSGVDTGHPDLAGRVRLIERVTPLAPDDPFGHGTHVCSIVAGDGTASAGRIQGIAPAATLVVQAICDASGRFSGLPVDMADLFQQAYDAGVRILNCSWGSSGAALYTTDAFELDQFVHEHPDLLIVVAAGNDGQQPSPFHPWDALGRIDYSSIASPATAKNTLTVGASCSSRSDGPHQGSAWAHYPGSHPPQLPPLSEEPICGDPDLMAAFSSRGPTDDERIKPDLVAPGTAILAARSSPSSPRFPEPAFGGHYAYLSGTSMSAPAATGAATIVRQYYMIERGQNRPSAALLKATLINGAVWLPAQTAQDPNIGQPNFHQGFGRLDLANALPVPGNADGFGLQFVDIDNASAAALNSEQPARSTWKKRIRVTAGMPLRLTLCWTDHPAHGLQNQLDLRVRSPSGQMITGNPGMVRRPWAKSDRDNNVERIEVETPEAGDWTVIVEAETTPRPQQGFSLVASGKVSAFF